MFGRNKIAMLVAEFLGTGVLTLVVLSVVYSPTVGYPSYFIAGAAALVLIAMTLTLGRVSGAQLNPAITIGMWSARLVKTLPALAYIATQLLGAMAAYWLFTYFSDAHFPAVTKFDSHILVAEAVGALIFSLGWAGVVYQKLPTGKAASAVGTALFLGIMVASLASAGLLNPAVALGMQSWVWGTYVLGPVLGAIIGFNLYALLFAPTGANGTLAKEGAVELGETEDRFRSVASRPTKKRKK